MKREIPRPPRPDGTFKYGVQWTTKKQYSGSLMCGNPEAQRKDNRA